MTLTYCGTATEIKKHNQHHKDNHDEASRKPIIPLYQVQLGKELDIITQHLKGNLRKKLPFNIMADDSSLLT